MHRILSAAGSAPSHRHTTTTRLPLLQQAGRCALGLAALMCATVGCSAANSPVRDASLASDAELSEAPLSSGAPLPAMDAELLTATPVAHSGVATSPSSEPALDWLSPSHIGAAVRAHHGDFQACQALGDLESRREDGAVTVGWLVKADGSVNQVTVGHSTFTSRSINACVLDVARQVTFPRSAAPTQVSWTVKFRGAPHGPLAASTR